MEQPNFELRKDKSNLTAVLTSEPSTMPDLAWLDFSDLCTTQAYLAPVVFEPLA